MSVILVSTLQVHSALAQVGEDNTSETTVGITSVYQINILPTSLSWGTGISTSEVLIDGTYTKLETQNIGTAACDVLIKTNATGSDHLGNWIMIKDSAGSWYYITLNITTTTTAPVSYEISWTGHGLTGTMHYGFFYISDAAQGTEKFQRFWFVHNTTYVKVDLDRDGLVSDETNVAVGGSFVLTLPAGFTGVGTTYYVKQLAAGYARFGHYKDDSTSDYGVDYISDLAIDGINQRDWLCAVPYGMAAGDYAVLITLTAAAVAA